MTRRYNLSHPAGQPMPEDWIHLPDSVVAAADYDAVSARLAEAETNAEWAQHWKDKHDTVEAEIERLRAGLQLIAGDKNRLMNEVARQTAASILGGKPIGEVPEWPTREEAEKRAAELMAIGRATLGENDDWLCFQRPAQPKVTP